MIPVKNNVPLKILCSQNSRKISNILRSFVGWCLVILYLDYSLRRISITGTIEILSIELLSPSAYSTVLSCQDNNLSSPPLLYCYLAQVAQRLLVHLAVTVNFLLRIQGSEVWVGNVLMSLGGRSLKCSKLWRKHKN